MALRSLTFLDKLEGRPSSLVKVAASRIYLYNNRHEEAVTEATRAIAQDPNDPEAYIAMAWAMITTGRPEPGLELVERAMRLNPSYPNYYAIVLFFRILFLFVVDAKEVFYGFNVLETASVFSFFFTNLGWFVEDLIEGPLH